jgi:hypothetical protein
MAPIARSAPAWARRMPASSDVFFTRRRSSKISPCARSETPFSRKWSAASSGNVRGVTASSSPIFRQARTTSSRSASYQGSPCE